MLNILKLIVSILTVYNFCLYECTSPATKYIVKLFPFFRILIWKAYNELS